jgi:hypothetical protein
MQVLLMTCRHFLCRISLAKSNSRISEVEPVYHASQWKQVKPGEDMAFTIEGRDKMRHKVSHPCYSHFWVTFGNSRLQMIRVPETISQ